MRDCTWINRRVSSRRVVAAVLLWFSVVSTALGCTIVHYADRDKDGGSGGETPAVVDLLVMAPLDRNAVNLAGDYNDIVVELDEAMERRNIELRKAALAPLYGRVADVVPLVYGADDDGMGFASYADAILFYARDGGAQYLNDQTTVEGENLSRLSTELDTRAIYRPTGSDPAGRIYFAEPADGFVVLYLSPQSRRCALDGADCTLGREHPVDYFTREQDSVASWLRLPDGGLPVSKIFHAAVVTEEGIPYDEFSQRCVGYAEFPTAHIDLMEPSPLSYYQPLVAGIRDNGGHTALIDLCEAMSSRRKSRMEALAGEIRTMVD
ncbi:MAG: hypothetical protein MJE77_01955 [Proteobacteria bacterium]|nr:hypothetical protein [Pseudomonadota bacterium]